MKFNLSPLLSLLITTLAFFIAAQNILAAELSPAQDSLAREIFGQVMSPYCPGRLLQDCPSGQAQELREKIKAELVAGKNKADVMSGLLAVYGDEVRAAPTAQGFGLVAWIMPGVFLLTGLLALCVWLLKRRPSSAALGTEKLDAKMRARLEAEIRES